MRPFFSNHVLFRVKKLIGWSFQLAVKQTDSKESSNLLVYSIFWRMFACVTAVSLVVETDSTTTRR
jgi:hypothetical protein